MILDEAYYEFVDDPLYAGSHRLVLESNNVVSTRTFSKVHGLAGLRIGYGIAAPEVAEYAWRAHVPFSVSLVAQAAAEASMRQTEAIAGRARFMTGGARAPPGGLRRDGPGVHALAHKLHPGPHGP